MTRQELNGVDVGLAFSGQSAVCGKGRCTHLILTSNYNNLPCSDVNGTPTETLQLFVAFSRSATRGTRLELARMLHNSSAEKEVAIFWNDKEGTNRKGKKDPKACYYIGHYKSIRFKEGLNVEDLSKSRNVGKTNSKRPQERRRQALVELEFVEYREEWIFGTIQAIENTTTVVSEQESNNSQKQQTNTRKSKRKQPENTQYIQAWIEDEEKWCRAKTQSSLEEEMLIVDFVDWSADDGWDCKRIPKAHVSEINSVQYGKMGRGKVYKDKQFQTSVGASSASSTPSSLPAISSERPCKRIKVENHDGEHDGKGEYKEQTTTPETDTDDEEEVGINEMEDVKMAVKIKQDTNQDTNQDIKPATPKKSAAFDLVNNGHFDIEELKRLLAARPKLAHHIASNKRSLIWACVQKDQCWKEHRDAMTLLVQTYRLDPKHKAKNNKSCLDSIKARETMSDRHLETRKHLESLIQWWANR